MTYGHNTWRDDAACAHRAGRLTDPWFPDDNKRSGGALAAHVARDVCASCPVAAPCLSEILTVERGRPVAERHGIFAGFNPEQRHALGEDAAVHPGAVPWACARRATPRAVPPRPAPGVRPLLLRTGYIDATGTARRLQAAALNGWSVPYIARAAYVNPDTVMVLRRLHTRQVPVVVADRIAGACADLTRRRAPDSVGARAAHGRARASGWVPAHAWRDIDDPSEARPHDVGRATA